MPVVVGGTSYYIESLIYDNLVPRPADRDRDGRDEDDDDDADDADDAAADETESKRRRGRPHDDGGGDDDLSAAAFREYAPFRHRNDAPAAATAEAAGRMYADALAEAVRFARTMPAVGRLSSKRYRNTFAPQPHEPPADGPSAWPSAVAECETAALYAHGVRWLDAVAAAGPAASDAAVLGRCDVCAADVAAGHSGRYARADVRSRLDGLLRLAADGAHADDALAAALRRAHAAVERRVQRLALALLAERERTAVDLVAAADLKAHAAYFDPVAANELHPHNTRKVFRYVRVAIDNNDKCIARKQIYTTA